MAESMILLHLTKEKNIVKYQITPCVKTGGIVYTKRRDGCYLKQRFVFLCKTRTMRRKRKHRYEVNNSKRDLQRERKNTWIKRVTVGGWVRSVRDSKTFDLSKLHDGSSLRLFR